VKKRDREELDLVSARFEIGAVAQMINDGVIKDVTTVAAFGLLKSKGLL
jgi:ADP-ribose pyrophosphatase